MMSLTWLILFLYSQQHISNAFPIPISSKRSNLYSSIQTTQEENEKSELKKINESQHSLSASFDSIAKARYACTRFLRNPSPNTTNSSTNVISNSNAQSGVVPSGTVPNPEIIDKAKKALIIAQRAPSGFNAQPYRAILVSDPQIKDQISQYCLGRNADRVRDSDCTVVFVADCQCTRDFFKLKELLIKTSKKPLSKWMLRKIQILIALFSSGYPLPRILSNTISYCVRTSITLLGTVSRHKILLPSLASSETWASKNTMLFAMMYMLSCSSKNVATCPMEGYQAAGLKRILKIPQGGRFKIPLIVSTGLPYNEDESDDAGMSHGRGGKQERFPLDQVIFENKEFQY